MEESVQVSAHKLWDITVGHYRHVSIADASVNMVDITARALSRQFPDVEVRVDSGLRIRARYKAGDRIPWGCSLSEDEVNPFSTPEYRRCWKDMMAYPVVAWVDQEEDGKRVIL